MEKKLTAARYKEQSGYRRENDLLYSLSAWTDKGGDNSDRIARLQRNLRRVRAQELTVRQREMLHMYYEQGMNMPQIAAALKVNKSTVSRTLARCRKILKRYLQYSL